MCFISVMYAMISKVKQKSQSLKTKKRFHSNFVYIKNYDLFNDYHRANEKVRHHYYYIPHRLLNNFCKKCFCFSFLQFAVAVLYVISKRINIVRFAMSKCTKRNRCSTSDRTRLYRTSSTNWFQDSSKVSFCLI